MFKIVHLGNSNGAIMGGFGRGQNYLAPTQGNFIANSQNMNSYSSGSNIGMLQHGQQERQRGNSNPFEAMTAAAPQLKTLSQTKAENPFAPMMEQSSFPSSGNTGPNNAAMTMTNSQSNDTDKFMYFNNGRRVSMTSDSNTANRQDTPNSNRDSQKRIVLLVL